MSCPICHGRHLRLRPGRGSAVAERCSCAQVCPECGGSGWISRGDVARRCGCARIERRIDQLNAANIPARYHDCTATNFLARLHNHDYVLEYLDRWVSGFSERQNGLLLVGEVGLGKTHLAVAVLRRLVEDKEISCRFVEFAELLADIRGSFGIPGGEKAVLGPLVEMPVLVVDELGGGKGSEWEQSILDHLISSRYNRNLTTIFTTNYPLEATDTIQEQGQPVAIRDLRELGNLLEGESLERRVGPRIYSRVLDMCKVMVLRGGGDYRLQRVRDRS